VRVIDGRYEPIKKLGEGGMGEVWLVKDRENKGKEIALKFISSGMKEGERGGCFKHEFELLSKLRHPNLVEVYDFGQAEEGCFFTMEYVAGEDLFSYAQKSSPTKLMEEVVGVLRALEYIHSRGLIHYDVKPENIRVGKEGEVVKLMDLGLAGEGGMATAGRVKGTLAYIAPELARGIEVDKRADLYSLGVTLWYILSGELPYGGRTPWEVVRSQVGKGDLSVPASFPSPWKEILPRLLSPEPSERYSSANEVIRAINELTGKKFPTETQETKASYILSGKFVGRAKELEQLTRIMEERFAGEGEGEPTLVLLQGERGVGKKRLLRELRYRAQLEGFGFYSGRCYEDGGDPYGPWAEILRRLVVTLDMEDQTLKPYSPELVKLLPSLIDAQPSPELEPDQEKLRLYEAVTNFLCQISTTKPLLLSLTDIQWADGGTLEFLSYLARNSGKEKIFICGALQEGEGQPALLKEMEGEEYFQSLPLERLQPAEVEELIASMLGTKQVPQGLKDKVISRTGGNPLLLEETMKSLSEEGIIYRQDGRWRCNSKRLAAFEIPGSVSRAVEKRLERLSPEELKVLQALAVINHPVELQLLWEVLSLSPEDLHVAVSGLEAKRLVRKSWQSGKACGEISHQTTSNLVYSRIPPEERKALHQKVGSVLEKGKAGVEELAFHYQRGWGGGKAASYCYKAGLRAKKLYSNERAISYLQAALENLGEKRKGLKGKILGELGEVFRHTGELEKASDAYERALRDYGAEMNQREKAQLHIKLASAWENRSQYEKALAVLQEGRELLGSGAQGRLPAEILANMAMVELRKGDFDSCLKLGQEGLEVLGSRKTCREGGLLYNVLGNAYFYRGDPKKAEKFYLKSLGIREKLGNQRAISSSLNNLGNIYFVQGEHSKSIDYHKRSMEISDRIGNILGVSGSYMNLGNVYQVGGQISKALSYFQRSLEINQRVGDKNGLAACMNNIAGIYIDKGEYGEAEKLFRQSREIFRQIGNKFGEAMCYTNMGITYFARGKYSQALGFYRKGLKMARLLGNSELEAVSHNNLGEAYLTLGRVRGARKEVETVISMMEKSGEKLLLAEAYNLLGKADLAAGELQRAEETQRKALEYSTLLGDERFRGRAFVDLGHLALKQERSEEALGYCEEAL